LRPVIILVTSLDGGVGKTTLTAAMAYHAAVNKRQPVLLIDADWEKAELSQLFRAEYASGWLSPFLKGEEPNIYKIRDGLFLIPGYDAAEAYQLYDFQISELERALEAWVENLPAFTASRGLPPAAIVDTTPTLRLSFLTRLKEKGVKIIFVADVRAVSRVSDVKAEHYAAYFKLADAVVVNNTSFFTSNTAPYTIRRISTPKDLHWEAVAKALLKNRHNRKTVEALLDKVYPTSLLGPT
jgi:MinD-like ATPase involved in chromosome partitioning or flagellar assembly